MGKNRFYVYLHRHPQSGEIVYVGKGTNGRAWDVTRSRAGNEGHLNWMKSLVDLGYIPCDWVTILYKELTEAEAFSKEKSYLHENGPLPFNRQCGESQHQSKLTNLEAKKLFRLSWSGEFQRDELAKLFGVCPSNVSMIKYKKQWKSVLRKETNENYEKYLQSLV